MKQPRYTSYKTALLIVSLTSIFPIIANALAFESSGEAKPFKAGDLEQVKQVIENVEYSSTKSPYILIQALNFAIYSGNIELIKYLASRGWLEKCSNESLCAPIHMAARHELDKSKPMIEFFISHGFNPVSGDMHGNTALHSAARYGDVGLVNYLCGYGIDETIKHSYSKETALELAKRQATSTRLSLKKEEDARRRENLTSIIEYLESGQCIKK